MIQVKVCEHYKNRFGNIPSDINLMLNLDLNTINLTVLEYLKHLKENPSCYAYSGLSQSIDDLLNQVKNSLLEMLKMLE
jgi:hypothetical protein